MLYHLEPAILPFQWIQHAHQHTKNYRVIVITIPPHLSSIKDISPGVIVPSAIEQCNGCTARPCQETLYILQLPSASQQGTDSQNPIVKFIS